MVQTLSNFVSLPWKLDNLYYYIAASLGIAMFAKQGKVF